MRSVAFAGTRFEVTWAAQRDLESDALALCAAGTPMWCISTRPGTR